MILLNGKSTAEHIKKSIKKEVDLMISNGKKRPHLAAILVGNDGASQTYVNAKVKACKDVGFKSTLIKLDNSIPEKDLIEEVISLNNNKQIDGFIVQLPLPKHLNENNINFSISPDKDVDGFHPINIGKMTLNISSFLPATPYGIIQLLEHYKIETSGKNCVIVGRSNIVGKPLSILLSSNNTVGNCTVTLCHSKTKKLHEICKKADILIAALGKKSFVKSNMVKEGAVVIDVGITRVKSNKTKSGFTLKGDVDFNEVATKCSFITPVPGGVGPMTIVSLLKNTLLAAQRR